MPTPDMTEKDIARMILRKDSGAAVTEEEMAMISEIMARQQGEMLPPQAPPMMQNQPGAPMPGLGAQAGQMMGAAPAGQMMQNQPGGPMPGLAEQAGGMMGRPTEKQAIMQALRRR